MKTDTSYILQHSLLTREVFIITYIEVRGRFENELRRALAHSVLWTRYLTRVFNPGGTKGTQALANSRYNQAFKLYHQPRDLGVYPRSKLHDQNHPPSSGSRHQHIGQPNVLPGILPLEASPLPNN